MCIITKPIELPTAQDSEVFNEILENRFFTIDSILDAARVEISIEENEDTTTSEACTCDVCGRVLPFTDRDLIATIGSRSVIITSITCSGCLNRVERHLESE